MTHIITSFVPLAYNRNIIAEASSQGGPVTLHHVVLQRANAKNQNGRRYPKPILERELVKYNEEFIKQRRALGELDHPESPVVNLKNVSHNITEAHFEGDDLIGDIEILSTPSGNILKELIRNNIRLGISSRGMGSVRELGEGDVEVQDDFNLLCFDVVSNPSTHGAFINETVDLQVDPFATINVLVYDFLSEVR